MNVQQLNDSFGITGQLAFVEDASGLIVAEIDNQQAAASLCLQGAQLLQWQPHALPQPVLWRAAAAQLAPGKSPHCGAPVCWPWFGVHASDSALPAHGFARILPWSVVASGTQLSGATHLRLRLQQSVQPAMGWLHAATLELDVVVGDRLHMALVTRNVGDTDFVIGEALHTYFQVGDIARVRVTGLDGVTYADKVENFARHTQRDAITFAGETDRVYLDTVDACVIEDDVLGRRIRIAKSGSATTVVWTPWREKAASLYDLGADGWRHMLCVESANALDNLVAVPAGGSHTLAVDYSVEAG